MLINKKEEKILFILVERDIDISQSICIYCIVVKEFKIKQLPWGGCS